jgi:hypothetical protein
MLAPDRAASDPAWTCPARFLWLVGGAFQKGLCAARRTMGGGPDHSHRRARLAGRAAHLPNRGAEFLVAQLVGRSARLRALPGGLAASCGTDPGAQGWCRKPRSCSCGHGRGGWDHCECGCALRSGASMAIALDRQRRRSFPPPQPCAAGVRQRSRACWRISRRVCSHLGNR